MNNQMKIKIIKKNTECDCSIPVVKEEVQNQQTTRKMAAAVSDWVNDFQHRRRQETRQARDFYNSNIVSHRQTQPSV